ncbi:MAG: hypothetical protein AAGH92_07820 [Planctomycetota bacterium]
MTGFPNPNSAPHDPYGQGPAAAPQRRPGVVLWFKIYLFVSIAFGALMALSGLLIVGDPVTALQSMRDAGQIPPGTNFSLDDMRALGWVYGVAGLLGVVLPVAWFLTPFGGAKWVLGVVLIALGMPGLVTLILLIPLLIFWVREDCKAWCRGASSVETGPTREPWD